MKKLCTCFLAFVLLAGCSQQTGNELKEDGSSDALQQIIVGASPSPHAVILNEIKDDLKEKGYELVIKEFDDYVIPNTALDGGELDANYFQHEPYLLTFNVDHDTHISNVLKVHFEPLGIYAGKDHEAKDSFGLDDLSDGAVIAVPNDATNRGRALQLLDSQGVITLKEGVDVDSVTVLDIVENPKNIEIQEIEAKMIPTFLPDVDYAVINGNYALSAGITDKVCVAESKESEGAQKYANILAVKEGNEESDKTKALIEALTSDEVKAFIEEEFDGLVVPVF